MAGEEEGERDKETYENVHELLQADREHPLTPSLNFGIVNRVPKPPLLRQRQVGVHLLRVSSVRRHSSAGEQVVLRHGVADEEERRGKSADELVCVVEEIVSQSTFEKKGEKGRRTQTYT